MVNSYPSIRGTPSWETVRSICWGSHIPPLNKLESSVEEEERVLTGTRGQSFRSLYVGLRSGKFPAYPPLTKYLIADLTKQTHF